MLYVDTICEEKPFPWSRIAPGATRLNEARAALRSLPAATFYPFTRATAWRVSDLKLCAAWPDAAPAPPPATGLPDVPTLILSGEQDLRTPTSGAVLTADRIPDAQLLRVPFVGHAVLGTDLSGCAQRAVVAFFTAHPVGRCSTRNKFPVTPLPPRKLGELHPPRSVAGKPGRTITAAEQAIDDLIDVVVAAELHQNYVAAGSSVGGLHGGYAKFGKAGVLLHDYSYVPGILMSGTLPYEHHGHRPRPSATVRISGSQGADGTIIFSHARIRGTLGGTTFNISNIHATAATSGQDLPSEDAVRRLAEATARARRETVRLPVSP